MHKDDAVELFLFVRAIFCILFKFLQVRWDVIEWVTCLVHYALHCKVIYYSIIHVRSWVRTTYGIHEHWSPTNNIIIPQYSFSMYASFIICKNSWKYFFNRKCFMICFCIYSLLFLLNIRLYITSFKICLLFRIVMSFP